MAVTISTACGRCNRCNGHCDDGIRSGSAVDKSTRRPSETIFLFIRNFRKIYPQGLGSGFCGRVIPRGTYRPHFQIIRKILSDLLPSLTAAAGALRATGLGTAARGPPLRRRRPHKLKICEILNFWLRKFWSEIDPNGPGMDTKRTRTGLRTDPRSPESSSRCC